MPGDAIQQIKERLSIVDVVSPYVELHKAGKNLKGKSPFTHEKTPSFFVSPDRGMYYCFSSSKGGDIFTFVQEMEGVDFKGALKILAEKANVELVPEDPKKRDERETQYAILHEAALYFQRQLAEKDDAKSYLQKRGLKPETIARWQIGYAPGPPDFGWRELRIHLHEKKYADVALLRAGLIKEAGVGKEPYDVFRDRVMFPISDPSGRVVAFSGRILSKDSDAPKYVNSPETALFNKSEILYGYDKAKEGIRKFDFTLLVEGQFDVVLAHQAGYTNAVAVSGTAFTDHHASLVGRLSNRVVLALDADRAGIAAVGRAADTLLSRGMDVKVARLPDGKDPADIVHDDPKQFKAIIGKASHVIEFMLAVLKENSKDERTFKLRAREEVLPYVLRIANQIDREHFVGRIAEQLQTTPDSVRLEVARLEQEAAHAAARAARPITAQAEHRETTSTTRLAEVRAYLAAVHGIFSATERAALEATLTAMGVSMDDMRTSVPEDKKSQLLFVLESRFTDMSENAIWQETVDLLNEYKVLETRMKIAAIKQELLRAEQEANETERERLLQALLVQQRALGESPLTVDIFKG